jgi:hypothetical protein
MIALPVVAGLLLGVRFCTETRGVDLRLVDAHA